MIPGASIYPITQATTTMAHKSHGEPFSGSSGIPRPEKALNARKSLPVMIAGHSSRNPHPHYLRIPCPAGAGINPERTSQTAKCPGHPTRSAGHEPGINFKSIPGHGPGFYGPSSTVRVLRSGFYGQSPQSRTARTTPPAQGNYSLIRYSPPVNSMIILTASRLGPSSDKASSTPLASSIIRF